MTKLSKTQLEKKIAKVYGNLKSELGSSEIDLIDELVSLEIRLALKINKQKDV